MNGVETRTEGGPLNSLCSFSSKPLLLLLMVAESNLTIWGRGPQDHLAVVPSGQLAELGPLFPLVGIQP